MTSTGPILVVDDDKGWQETLELLLVEEGYAVKLAASHGEALGTILREDLSLCTVDLELASTKYRDNLHGLSLLTICSHRQIPTIVVSAWLAPDVAERIFLPQYGAYACFEKKDFPRERFLAKVREAVVSGYRASTIGHTLQGIRSPGPMLLDGLGFHAKWKTLVDEVFSCYEQAHTNINDRQRKRMSVRRRLVAEDEALWQGQLIELDKSYNLVMHTLGQINSVGELDEQHAEILRICRSWLSSFPELSN